jgi:3'-phosphoadenosine 5'-phosphosulfate sulfotransferase (PAPS reductase)/FAD synthetase
MSEKVEGRFDQFADNDNYRHVLGLSGGKDSAALAIYIKEQYPQIHEKVEYFFSDTGAELREAYEFLDKLEAYLGKEIVRLSSGRDFDHWLKQNNGLLPSPQIRWCTRTMKIKPFEDFVGNDLVVSYVGIRADEFREGYRGDGKENIKPVFPFIDDGLVRDDVFQLLEDTVGVPEYYKWRSRSGCFFCFFQRQDEWLGLKRNHPDLFERAKDYEARMRNKYDWKDGEIDVGGVGYTWSSQGSLDEMVAKAEAREKKLGIIATSASAQSDRWQDVLRYEGEDDDPEDQACQICSL